MSTLGRDKKNTNSKRSLDFFCNFSILEEIQVPEIELFRVRFN